MPAVNELTITVVMTINNDGITQDAYKLKTSTGSISLIFKKLGDERTLPQVKIR